MVDPNTRMTKVRANFMKYWESQYGRKPSVTRQELRDDKGLQTFIVGPLGLTLSYPAWLTNYGEYTTGVGTYSLPWDAYDTFMKMKYPSSADPGDKADKGKSVSDVSSEFAKNSVASA